MHSLFIGQDGSKRLARETPAFAVSMILAELFYKFGSFSLECVAFLGTWYTLSALIYTFFPSRTADAAAKV